MEFVGREFGWEGDLGRESKNGKDGLFGSPTWQNIKREVICHFKLLRFAISKCFLLHV